MQPTCYIPQLNIQHIASSSHNPSPQTKKKEAIRSLMKAALYPLQKGLNISKRTLANEFIIRCKEDDAFFFTHIDQLQTLDIASEYGPSLFGVIIRSKNSDKIAKFIQRMEFLNELTDDYKLTVLARCKQLIAEKNPQQEINLQHIVDRIENTPNVHSIHSLLVAAAATGDTRLCQALIDSREDKEDTIVEIILGAILSANIEIVLHFLPSISNKKLLDALSLSRIKTLTQISAGGSGYEVSPGDNALDIAIKNERERIFYLLVKEAYGRKDISLQKFLEDWFASAQNKEKVQELIKKKITSNQLVKLEKKSAAICPSFQQQKASQVTYQANLSKKETAKLIARLPLEQRQQRREIKTVLHETIHWLFLTKASSPLPFPQHCTRITHFHLPPLYPIEGVKMNSFYEIRKKVGRTFLLASDKAIELSTAEKDIIDNSLLTHLLNGKNLEFIYNFPGTITHLNNTFWDNWISSPGEWNEVYRDIIHPTISQAALNIFSLLVQKYPATPLSVVELCGGTGSLAKQLLQQASSKGITDIQYILLENNEKELAQAKKELKEYKTSTVVKTDIVNDNYCSDAQGRQEIVANSVDLFLGSGALATHVLKDKDSGLQALKKIAYYLKPEGYLLLASHSAPLLYSEDFERAGFRTINCSLPGYARNLHIVQKIGCPTICPSRPATIARGKYV